MLELNKIYLGDCLKLMPHIADNSVDMILCDLPYQVLHKNNPNAQWDRIIPFDAHWHTHERAFRDCGGMSWYFSDTRIGHLGNCGCADPASECLKWKKWCINTEDAEIFQFFEHMRKYCESNEYLIEGEV